MSLELSLLGEILRVARDPNVNLDVFRELVARSPQLASEVVRVSNSAIYGMEGKINRLERAVLILGMRSVTEIASTLLVAREMRSLEIGGVSGDALWLHGLETAACAQLLARSLGLPLESEAYLSGLIHDLGIVDLHAQHGAAYADSLRCTRHEDVALHELERAILGEDHCQRLARRCAEWGFPELLRQAVEHHHDPSAAPIAARPLAMLLCAAHVVVDQPLGGWRDQVSQGADASVLGALGLDEGDVEDVREELRARLKDMISIFR